MARSAEADDSAAPRSRGFWPGRACVLPAHFGTFTPTESKCEREGVCMCVCVEWNRPRRQLEQMEKSA